jgi:hypothetical protein
MERMDAQTSQLIREFQGATLAQPGASDEHRVPPGDLTLNADPSVYNSKRPETTNPTAAELDVETDPNTEAPTPAEIFEGLEPVTSEDAASVLKLDLTKTLAYAIEFSPEYRNQKESLFLDALSLLLVKHRWGPRFFDDVTARVSGTPEAGDHDQALTLINDFRVTQRLPYGGEVAASALVDFVNTLRSEVGDEGETQSARLGLSVSIPLLRGAGLIAQEDLIQSERNLIYAARDFEQFRRSFLVDIATDYFDLLQAQQQIINRQLQLENVTAFAQRAEALAEAGRQPYIDAQEAQTEVLSSQDSLISARQSYALSLDRFKVRLGIPATQVIDVQSAEIIVPTLLLEPDKAQRAALTYRLDLQTRRDLVGDAQRAVKNARNGLLPDLDFDAAIGINTDPDKDRAGVDFDAGASNYSAGLRLGVPLDRREEEIGVRRALISLERAKRQYDLDRNNVTLTVRDSIRRIRQATFTLELQDRNIAIAEQRFRGVRLRERNLRPSDVIDAQQRLLDARNRRDQAERDLRVSLLQFLRETGQLRVTSDGQWLPPVKVEQAMEAAAEDNAGQPGPVGESGPRSEAYDELPPLPAE